MVMFRADLQRVQSAVQVFRNLAEKGILTTSAITNANTVAGFQAVIDAMVFDTDDRFWIRTATEALNEMVAYGVLSTAIIGPLTTLASLITAMATNSGFVENEIDLGIGYFGGQTYQGNVPTASV